MRNPIWNYQFLLDLVFFSYLFQKFDPSNCNGLTVQNFYSLRGDPLFCYPQILSFLYVWLSQKFHVSSLKG